MSSGKGLAPCGSSPTAVQCFCWWSWHCCLLPFSKRRAEGDGMALGPLCLLKLPTVFPRSCFLDHYLSVIAKSLFSKCRLQGFMWWNEKWLPQNGRLEGRWLQYLCCTGFNSFWHCFCTCWQGFCEALTCRQKMLRREETGAPSVLC